MNKKIITILATTVLCIGFASIAFANNIIEKAEVKDHKPLSEVTKPQVLDLLNASWNKGKNKLVKIKGDKVKDWRLINVGDVDIEFVKNLSEDEATSFNNAFFSDERKKSLQKGDRIPALLISNSSDEAILFWERENGNFVFINLFKSANKNVDGTSSWLNGPATEIE